MSRVDFYHLQRASLEEVLPKLLQKAYATGKRIRIKTPNEETAETLSTFLWTYDDESFLPHGTKKDGFAEQQLIWLNSGDENSNNAEFIFLVKGSEAEPEVLQEYERVFNIFDGNSEEALQQARRLWKQYKTSGLEVYYWQQTERGSWQQKA